MYELTISPSHIVHVMYSLLLCYLSRTSYMYRQLFIHISLLKISCQGVSIRHVSGDGMYRPEVIITILEQIGKEMYSLGIDIDQCLKICNKLN